jgi:hypothetical protein
LAKGNSYASSVVFSHSSDLKTMEEIFGLPNVNNPIPASETNNFGSFNNVATANDLSDLFVSGAIPAPASASVTGEGFVFHPNTQTYSQVVHIRNDGTSPIPEPLWLTLDNLSANATVSNADGTTAVLAPLGSPYVVFRLAATASCVHTKSRRCTWNFSTPAVTRSPTPRASSTSRLRRDLKFEFRLSSKQKRPLETGGRFLFRKIQVALWLRRSV